MYTKFKAIIAGGGTGGHLYPAIAIAREIEKRFPESEIMFFGTSRGLEAKIIPQIGYSLKLIWLKGLQRKLSVSNLILPLQVMVSLWQCATTILRFKPRVVIGTGGYVSAPALFIAAIFGYPTIIQEQNSYPGIATRILAYFVDQVHLNFEESEKYFKKKSKIYISGNPVREDLTKISREEAAKRLGIDSARKTLLIFGGSQGAHTINQAILDIIDHLMARKAWQLVWGSGERDYDVIVKACHKYGTRIIVRPFIRDMAAAYAAADLVVSRAGATTLAELQVCGLPAVLIPYPYATAGHQEANARALVKQNAAVMILNDELKSDKFRNTLFSLMENEKKRVELGRNLKATAKPAAAAKIVDEMIKCLK